MVAKVAEHQITIHLSDEERDLLDAARGSADMATYVTHTAVRAARRKAARVLPPPISDEELTPEEHLRLAAEARNDSMEVGEFFRKLHEDISHDRAAQQNGAAT